jgi:hypothetical protein
MIKKDATAILEEVKAKGQVAQDYLNLLLEGVDGRRYHIESD